MKLFENRKPTNHAIGLMVALLVILTLTIAIIASAAANTPQEPQYTSDLQGSASSSDEPTGGDSSDTQAGTEPTPLVLVAPTAGGKLLKAHATDALVWSPTMNDYRTHAGVDISGELGAPVYAVADGTIESVFTDPFMGVCIRIDHGDGIKSCYRNLADVIPESIAAGKTVQAGQVIGAIGETAIEEIAEDVHLHFELTQNDVYLDPADYLTYEVSGDTDYEG